MILSIYNDFFLKISKGKITEALNYFLPSQMIGIYKKTQKNNFS